ncbi:Hypothetical protein LUCI_3435 [Lucifera butyrica]|uniref:Uncharacterized protein n=1 Tax=Lucifera butyrica TaxID=1351585 RepID=A0A498RB45_9FIRM|nr:hypothetical protein [Lucifera butyrica]VBB08170.1 Hypothetical protein LUCI_3435 [Lucifera butyrica]
MIIIILTSCTAQKSNAIGAFSISSNQPNLTGNYAQEKNEVLLERVTERIHPSLPEFIFSIYGQEKSGYDHFYRIRKITIKRADQPEKVLQEIIFDKTATLDFPKVYDINTSFIVEDINFDGYKDIRLQLWHPAGPNIPYYYWIWDKDASTFIQNKELEQITSPKVDIANQTIISYVRDGAATYYKRTYKYLDGHIQLIKELMVEYHKETTGEITTHITVRELMDDEMMVVAEYDKPGRINLKEL